MQLQGSNLKVTFLGDPLYLHHALKTQGPMQSWKNWRSSRVGWMGEVEWSPSCGPPPRVQRPSEENGMLFSGLSPDNKLPEIIELKNHPWFVAVQFHPEFKSRPLAPHPLFSSFIKAAKKYK